MLSNMRAFIMTLAICRLMPFIACQMLLGSTIYENEKRQIRKTLIPGLLLNLLGNGVAGWYLTGGIMQTENPAGKIGEVLRMECLAEEAGLFAATIPVCLAFGILWGFILRILLRRKEMFRITRRRKAAVLLISAICLCAAATGDYAARNAPRQLHVTEICRKTYAAAVGDEEPEEICWVAVMNDGELACRTEVLWLSETEDEPCGYGFEELTIPAGESERLTMAYEHGIELRKDGGSTVTLSDDEGRILDQVTVPALADGQRWVRGADGFWAVQQGNGMAWEAPIPRPEFSALGGFYAEAFDLTIGCTEGYTVHYTLDCTEPTEESPVYEEPIQIRDVSEEENHWSSRRDLTAKAKQYPDPAEPVDKCTVIRAACFDCNGNQSETVTESYFVGLDDKNGYNGTMVMSLVTDPENLFGEDLGIYVLGTTFEEEYDPETEKRDWWWWPANYHQTGWEWERAAVIQLFGEDGERIVSQQAGVQIKGGASAALLPKGLNLYARKEYEDFDTIPRDLFGTGLIPKRISLSAGGNDTELKLKDWLVARLAGKNGIPQAHYVPCSLFLDGEYWGVYWVTEKIDEVYLAWIAGTEPENIALIKAGELKAGTEEDLTAYQKTAEFISWNDMSDPEYYRQAGELADLDNYAEYIAMEVYTGNTDWSDRTNNAAWRAKDTWTGEWGKWQWILFDLNHTSVFQNSQEDTLKKLTRKSEMLSSLMMNPDFRAKLFDRLWILAEEVFIPERAEQALEEYETQMWEALEKNHQRFFGEMLKKDKLEKIRTFLRERPAYVLNKYEKYAAGHEAD